MMAYKSTDPKRNNKQKEHIDQYSGCKVLVHMKKAKSPCDVKIVEDRDDPYLIHVIKYRVRSGAISESSLVLKPELNQWISIYEKEDFSKI